MDERALVSVGDEIPSDFDRLAVNHVPDRYVHHRMAATAAQPEEARLA